MTADLGRYDEWAIPPPEGAWSYEVDDLDAAYGVHPLWPFAGAVRVAPDTDLRSWRNEYVTLTPTPGAPNLVAATLRLFVREEGTGGYLVRLPITLSLADQRTFSHLTPPVEVSAQAAGKVSRLWRFVEAARADRDAGRPLLTASARHQAAAQ